MATTPVKNVVLDVVPSYISMNSTRPLGGACRETKEESLYLTMAALAFRRPRTIPYLLQAAWAFRARAWYLLPPFLPVPPQSYMRWRMETAYGDPSAVPNDDEIERYLRWTSRMRAEMKRMPDV